MPVPAFCRSLLLGFVRLPAHSSTRAGAVTEFQQVQRLHAGCLRLRPSHASCSVHPMLLSCTCQTQGATPPADTADSGQCRHSKSSGDPELLRGHIQWKPTLYHFAFSLCCRRSYSTGSHAGLQQAAAAAAAMKVSVRRGTCVSPGRARVQRLPDPGQPPELALSAKAVTSPQGQVCRPAQHGPACHMFAMFCAAC